MEYNKYPSMNVLLTEEDVKKWIERMVPGISYKDYWEIRNEFVNNFIPLEVSIQKYLKEKQIREWNKNDEKHYYKVEMLNGGRKYVYMCENMVKLFYPKKYHKV